MHRQDEMDVAFNDVALPIDVLYTILRYLCRHDWLTLSLVNSALYFYANQDCLWSVSKNNNINAVDLS